MIYVVHDFVSSLQPDVGEGFYTSPTCSCLSKRCSVGMLVKSH